MTDQPEHQTEKIKAQSTTAAQPSAQEAVRQITRRVTDLIDLLRSHRDILLKRGMNLPSGSLDGLRTLKTRLDALLRQLVDTQGELKQLRALAETTALINSSLTTDDVLNQVMDTVILLTGAERGYIVLKNRDTGEMEFTVARGMDQEQLSDEKGELVVSNTIVNQVADSGEPVLTDNASQDARYQDQKSIVGYQLRSILAVPLKLRDEVIGVVYCDNRILAGLFKQHELELLTAFANQAGSAIENARLFERARAQLAEVSDLRARLDNIFTSIASGVVSVDNDDRVLISNAAAHEIILVDDLKGKILKEALPEDINDEFFDILQRVRKEGIQADIEVEVPVDGTTRYWKLIASPLRDTGGISNGVVIVVDDLTIQRQHEAQLAEVRRYLPGALIENIRNVDDIDVGGQEREITVFSSDVRGFTTFSERLQPEELMETINKYLSIATDSINLYEGIIDKYMGDAVTGFFNTQLNPQEDHPVRAVQAAMQLILDLKALHEVLPEDERLYFGIGVHTDIAVLGNVGGPDRKEFAALGDAVNISKYLEGNAGPGEVVISEATYRLVEDTFECEQIEPIRPKPGYEDVVIYRVIRKVKGAKTGALMLDPELAAMLAELENDNPTAD